MKKLHLTFLNSEGKKHKIIPRIANENLGVTEVQQVMEEISGLSLFVKKGVTLFVAPASAKYVETIETELFSDEA
ncbi:hypothetical protein EsVE80_05400 [Enterococcus saigonensis]|uniref:DUF2922 domain-containing protein n=1 Tax=Enterococcus saigonensis TaxID=1805431 RepID=A0A679IPQ9_9ENTE|nr:DUF2922 domain-containing protein [Enterococcus saigonensis]BCA85017.1 hypothetical protein EsVE80_05400 [Enterococcus saigonensis]